MLGVELDLAIGCLPDGLAHGLQHLFERHALEGVAAGVPHGGHLGEHPDLAAEQFPGLVDGLGVDEAGDRALAGLGVGRTLQDVAVLVVLDAVARLVDVAQEPLDHVLAGVEDARQAAFLLLLEQLADPGLDLGPAVEAPGGLLDPLRLAAHGLVGGGGAELLEDPELREALPDGVGERFPHAGIEATIRPG